MSSSHTSPCEHSPALRRAIIRTCPEYYSWPSAQRDGFRLGLKGEARFRIQQAPVKELFGLTVASQEALENALDEFSNKEYVRLNSAMLPLEGVGEDRFFLNEYLDDGTTLLDFPTLGDRTGRESARR